MILLSSFQVSTTSDMTRVGIGLSRWVASLLMFDYLVTTEGSFLTLHQVCVFESVNSNAHFKVCVHLALTIKARIGPWGVFIHILGLSTNLS